MLALDSKFTSSNRKVRTRRRGAGQGPASITRDRDPARGGTTHNAVLNETPIEQSGNTGAIEHAPRERIVMLDQRP